MKQKTSPSWKEGDGRTPSSLKGVSSSSILRIHKGCTKIIEVCTDSLTWDQRNDIRFSIEKMLDCMSEMHSRAKQHAKPSKSMAGKTKKAVKSKCRWKPEKSKTSKKTKTTRGSTQRKTSVRSKKA